MMNKYVKIFFVNANKNVLTKTKKKYSFYLSYCQGRKQNDVWVANGY
jgi:hypothetical protein